MRHIDCSVFKNGVNLSQEVKRQMREYELPTIQNGSFEMKIAFWVHRLRGLLSIKHDNEMKVRN